MKGKNSPFKWPSDPVYRGIITLIPQAISCLYLLYVYFRINEIRGKSGKIKFLISRKKREATNYVQVLVCVCLCVCVCVYVCVVEWIFPQTLK